MTIKEFESILTTRILLDKFYAPGGGIRETYTYRELLKATVFTCNTLLKEYRLNRRAWSRIRGNRIFILDERSRRVIAEVAIISDLAKDGLRCRPRIELIGRGGSALPHENMHSLIKGRKNYV